MLPPPHEADSLAFLGERLGRGRRQVLLRDDELGAGVEPYDVARVGSEIDDAADDTVADVSSGPTDASGSASRIFSGRIV